MCWELRAHPDATPRLVQFPRNPAPRRNRRICAMRRTCNTPLRVSDPGAVAPPDGLGSPGRARARRSRHEHPHLLDMARHYRAAERRQHEETVLVGGRFLRPPRTHWSTTTGRTTCASWRTRLNDSWCSVAARSTSAICRLASPPRQRFGSSGSKGCPRWTSWNGGTSSTCCKVLKATAHARRDARY